MELSDEFGRVPDPLDGGSIGQHGTRQPGARTAKAAWSTPGLAGDLESLFAENLEQLSKGGMGVGRYRVCGGRGCWFGSPRDRGRASAVPGRFPPF